jgi:hypothetical protein
MVDVDAFVEKDGLIEGLTGAEVPSTFLHKQCVNTFICR